MRRSIVLIAIGLSLLLTACMAGDGFQDYKDAAQRTENISKGTSRTEVRMESVLNESLTEFKDFESFILTMEERFDHTADQSIFDVYFVSNDLGIDLKLYQKSSDEIYLKVPFIGGVYAINSNMSQSFGDDVDLQSFMNTVGTHWSSMLLSENIFVGEKTIIRNEDGEVKTTKFTVKPTSDQLEAFTDSLRKVILSNRGMLIDLLSKLPSSDQSFSLNESDFNKIVNAIFSSMKITRYEEIAYMDLDGYIIDEQIEIGIEYESKDGFTNIFKSQTIRIHTMNERIEKNQELDFSLLDNVDIMPIEKLMEWSVEQ